jgi:hypothetical protein
MVEVRDLRARLSAYLRSDGQADFDAAHGGYDAVQMAAALELRTIGSPGEFCAFDGRLNRAARRERLVISGV